MDIAKMLADGLTETQIGRVTGLRRKELRAAIGAVRHLRFVGGKYDARIKELRDQGMMRKDIAKEIGMSLGFVGKRVTQNGWQTVDEKPPIELAQVRKLVIAGYTNEAIASRFQRVKSAMDDVIAQVRQEVRETRSRMTGPSEVPPDIAAMNDRLHVEAVISQGGFIWRDVIDREVLTFNYRGQVVQAWPA